MRIIGKTDIGKNRAENQDNYRSGFLPKSGAYGIVCVGMGGAHDGRLASTVASDTLEEQLAGGLREGVAPEGIEPLMLDALELANAEVFARSGNGEQMMGTTAVCAVVAGAQIYIAHVGDSRAYLFHDGTLDLLTRDHSMVQEMVDSGVITEEEASVHPEKNVITRALGVEQTVLPSFISLPLPAGAILLLCTDGLTNMVSESRIAEILRDTDFYDAPSELVSDALLAGGNDNITLLLMQPMEGK